MAAICPHCDHQPAADAAVGSACASCGTSLIAVAPEVEATIGTVIDGRFEVLELIGKGGMGTVYRARQKSIGRDVALKLIDERLDRDVVAVKRFFREAQLASQLAHPNTVTVIEFGQHQDGRLYLAMELVRGRTLDQLLEIEGALSIERIVRIGTQICDALGAAHALAIVHRDLKLDNVMVLDGDGSLVKVLDFGLARSLVDVTSRNTATGIIAGTPRFMAPEVGLKAADPAPSQDMYALGVILAELALNEPMWSTPGVEAMFWQKMTPDVERVPEVLRSLVGKLLSPEPADRPTAQVTRAALVELGTGAPRASKPRIGLAETIELHPVAISAPTTSAFSPPREEHPKLELEAEWRPERGIKPVATEPSGLELEPEWQQKRAAKQAAAKAGIRPPAAKPPARGPGGIIAALVVAAALVGGAVFMMTRKSDKPALPLPATPTTVSIEIKSSPEAPVKIDGKKAGMTPLTFHVNVSNHKHVITATISGITVTREIIADHDQVVDLSSAP